MALWCATAVCIIIAELKADQVQRVFLLLAFILELPPLLYVSFVTVHWMCSRGQFGRRMLGRVCRWIGRNCRQTFVDGSEEFLPDRLINPEEYVEDLTDPVANQVEDSLSCQSSNSNAIETAY